MAVRCIIPGCNHTLNPKVFDTPMGDVHWKLVPKEFKRVYRRACRLFRRDPRKHMARWNRIWTRCRRAAIERSVGL